MAREQFGVHPVLEHALTAVPEALLPADLDALLPPRRKVTADELDALAFLCAHHLRDRVSPRARRDFDRLYALAARTVGRPPGASIDYTDLGEAAHRDVTYARGAVKVAAVAAYLPSAHSAADAVRLASDAAALTARTLVKDPDALHGFLRDLCAKLA